MISRIFRPHKRFLISIDIRNALKTDGILVMMAMGLRNGLKIRLLRFGIGWDNDLPLRPWPVFHRDYREHGAGWCGLFVVYSHEDVKVKKS